MKAKPDRNKELVKMHKDFPDLSYEELGKYFYISRQRVGKILKDSRKRSSASIISRIIGKLIKGG